MPPSVPIAIEWSPPSTSGRSPAPRASLDEPGDPLADLHDRRRGSARAGRPPSVASGTGERDVAPVGDVAAELADARLQPRVADRRRPHVDAAPPGAEVEPGADHATGWRLRAFIGEADHPASRKRRCAVGRPAELDAERRELRPRDQVVELVGKAVASPAGSAAGGKVVDRERLHREREIHDLDRVAVEAGDVDERTVDEDVHAAAAEHVGPHTRRARRSTSSAARGERRHVDLAIVVPGVREDAPSFRSVERVGADGLDRPVAVITTSASGSASCEPRDPNPSMCAVSARTGSSSTTVTRPPSPCAAVASALADPAVADDAELAAGGEHVREREHRRERGLPRAVGVVEDVLAARVVGRDAGNGRLPSASSARSRATPVVVSSLTPRSARTDPAARSAIRRVSSSAVVDHELGATSPRRRAGQR